MDPTGNDDRKWGLMRQKIKTEEVKLVSTLDVSIFEHLLDDDLRKTVSDIEGKRPKARQLVTELLKSDDHTVEKFCKVIAGLYPDLFKLLTGRPPTDSESVNCVQTYLDRARESVRKYGQNKIQTNTANLDDQFVHRRIADGTLVDSIPTDVDSLLQPDRKGSTTFIHGGPGTGKTWTLHRYMELWSKGLGAARYQCMVLLDMSFLAKLTAPITLKELLTRYCAYPAPADQPQYIKWIKERPDQMAILFDNADGLDKDNQMWQISDGEFKTHALDWCLALLNGNVLRGCCKVVTSRSCGVLREMPPVRRVTLSSLDWPQIQEFIQKNVPSDKREKVVLTLQNDDTLVSLCRIPLFCSMLCQRLQDSDTEIMTYTRIVTQLILDTTVRGTQDGQRKKRLVQTLQPLARLAGTKRSKDITQNTRTQYLECDFQRAKVTSKERLAMENCGILTFQDIKDASGEVQHVAEFVYLIFEVLFTVGNNLQDPHCDIAEVFTANKLMGRFFMAGITHDTCNESITVFKEALKIPESTMRTKTSEECIKKHVEKLAKGLNEGGEESALEAGQLTLESQSLPIAKEAHALFGTLNVATLGMKEMVVVAWEFMMKHGTKQKNIDIIEKPPCSEKLPSTDDPSVGSSEIRCNVSQEHEEEKPTGLHDERLAKPAQDQELKLYQATKEPDPNLTEPSSAMDLGHTAKLDNSLHKGRNISLDAVHTSQPDLAMTTVNAYMEDVESKDLPEVEIHDLPSGNENILVELSGNLADTTELGKKQNTSSSKYKPYGEDIAGAIEEATRQLPDMPSDIDRTMFGIQNARNGITELMDIFGQLSTKSVCLQDDGDITEELMNNFVSKFKTCFQACIDITDEAKCIEQVKARFQQLEEVMVALHKLKVVCTPLLAAGSLLQSVVEGEKASEIHSNLQYLSKVNDQNNRQLQYVAAVLKFKNQCISHLEKKSPLMTCIKECMVNALSPIALETKGALFKKCFQIVQKFAQFEKNATYLSENVLATLERATSISKENAELVRGRDRMALMSAATVDKIRKLIQEKSVLDYLCVIGLPSDCIPALIDFIENMKMVQEAIIIAPEDDSKSIVAVTKSSSLQQTVYFLKEDKSGFQRASIFLRDELRKFLKEKSIPSAFDVNTNELELFVTKEQESSIGNSLKSKIDSIWKPCQPIHVPYKIYHLDHTFEVRSECGSRTCFPGSGVLFEFKDGSNVSATAGALIKDNQDRVCVLSSCHGKKVHRSYLVESGGPGNPVKRQETKYIGEVYSTDPWVDACLMEVDNERLKERCDPCVPGMNIALCGPYTGRTEELKDKEVSKYGGKTKLTDGIITHCEFELPFADITDALIIAPQQNYPSFTQEGDSGSVIFRRTPQMPQGQGSNIAKREVLAMHSSTISGFKTPFPNRSLAFRLDNVFGEFEKKYHRRLRLMSVGTHNEADQEGNRHDKPFFPQIRAVKTRSVWQNSVQVPASSEPATAQTP